MRRLCSHHNQSFDIILTSGWYNSRSKCDLKALRIIGHIKKSLGHTRTPSMHANFAGETITRSPRWSRRQHARNSQIWRVSVIKIVCFGIKSTHLIPTMTKIRWMYASVASNAVVIMSDEIYIKCYKNAWMLGYYIRNKSSQQLNRKLILKVKINNWYYSLLFTHHIHWTKAVTVYCLKIIFHKAVAG